MAGLNNPSVVLDQGFDSQNALVNETSVILDKKKQIIAYSPSLELLTNLGVSEILGQTLNAVLNVSADIVSVDEYPNYLQIHGKNIHFEIEQQRMVTTKVQTSIVNMRWQIIDHKSEFLPDVQDSQLYKYRIQEAYKRNIRALQRFHEITTQHDVDFQQKVYKLLEFGVEIFDLRLGIVSKVTDNQYIVEHVYSLDNQPESGAVFEIQDTYCTHTLASDGPIAFHHTAISDIRNHPCYKTFKLEAYIGVPLIVNNQRYGTLNFSSPHSKLLPFSDIDYSLIRLFANWLGEEMTRQHSQMELQQQQRLFESMFRDAPDALVIVNPDKKITMVNSAFTKTFGYNASTCYKKHISMLYTSDEDYERQSKLQISHWAKNRLIPFEVNFKRQSGELFPAETITSVLFDKNGDVLGYLGHIRDVSQRHKAQLLMQSTLAMQRAILDSANYSIIAINTDGIINTFNASAERMLGYKENEVVQMVSLASFHNFEELKHRAYELQREFGYEVPLGYEVIIAKARLGEPDEREWTYIRKDGSQFPVRLSVTAMRDSDRIIGFLAVAADISKERETGKILHLLRRALDASINGVVITEAEGKHNPVIYVNSAFERITGFNHTDIMGKDCRVLQQGDSNQKALKDIRQAVKNRVEGRAVLRNYRKDGGLFWNELSIAPVRDNNGHVTHFVGVQNDITQRKQAEASINRFSNVLDNTLDMIFMFDPVSLHFVYLNKGAVESMGYEREELMAMKPFDIKPKFEESAFREIIQPLIDGNQPALNFETIHRRKDGSDFHVEIFLQLVKEDASAGLFVAIVRDITTRKKIERYKNEFISTVSHELRTPLTSIHGSLQLMDSGALGVLPEQAAHLVTIAAKNSTRLGLLINDLLDVEKMASGNMKFNMSKQALTPLIEQAVEANKSYGEQFGIRFVVDSFVGDVKICVDSVRFLQIMSNLMSNAAKFSPRNSLVNISVEQQQENLRINVTDNGPGIAKAFHDKIFCKFSQADASDCREKGGTGLGLSISKALVEHMGGKIGFTTREGVGTTFYFSFPIAH